MLWQAARQRGSSKVECSPAQNNASSDGSGVRPEPEQTPIVLTSFRSAAYSGLLRASGGGKRNCDGRVSTHGVSEAYCGPAPDALSSGVGRQTPTAPGVPTMPSAPANGGGGGAFPSVSLQAQMVSATVCPQVTPAAMELAFSVNASAASEALRRVVSVGLCAGYRSTRIA